MNNRVLTFDLNGVTGWTADPLSSSGGAQAICGHFTVDRDSDARGPCFLELERQAAILIEKLQPDLVSFEAPLPLAALKRMMDTDRNPFKRSPVTTATLVIRKTYGYAAILEKVCTQYGVEALPADVTQVRFHFVRDRGAKKEVVKAQCLRLGYPVKTLDEADAAAAWDWTHAQLRKRRLADLVAEARAAE